MKKSVIIFLALVFPVFCMGQKSNPDTVRVYYLGGQSNMDGFGYNSELPDSLKLPFENIWIFHGNPATNNTPGGGLGIWEPLAPGHGTNFSSDGDTNHLSDRFGVELSFASRMQALYPEDRIAIIKYSKGGTSIDSIPAGRSGCWEPDFSTGAGINHYDNYLTCIKKALGTKDINGDGNEDVLIPSGIVWMQGESDGQDEEVALRYYENLKRLMDLFRASLRKDDLPVVIGKISDSCEDEDGKVWNYGELAQYAQEKYARTDPQAAIVRSTRLYQYSDKWHYDGKGYIDLGKQFAEALYFLQVENDQ